MVTLKYNKLFLVGLNEERTSSHRVTERANGDKPLTVSFSGRFMLENGEDTYGTLVLDSDMWKRFEGKNLLPGMSTYEEAAETLVKLPNVFYGCPLCVFRSKDKEEANHHILEHAAKFMTQFEVGESAPRRGRKKNGSNECE